MPQQKRYAIDPETGESLPLRELSRRYGLDYTTISHRWQRGKRGAELVAPVAPNMVRKAQPTPIPATETRAAERRERIRQVLEDPALRPLTRPLVPRHP